ncbi:MAG: hypothetical protein QM651_10955 [Rhodoblastus sp.]
MNLSDGRRAAIQTACEISCEVLAAWRERLGREDPASRGRADAKVEKLVRFLVDSFPAGATVGEAQKVAVEEGDKLSLRYLETLRPAAVPLAVMRELLAEREVTFDVRAVPSWALFAQRYGDVILAIDTGRARRTSVVDIGNAAAERAAP